MAGVPQEPADRPLEDTGAHWGTTWGRVVSAVCRQSQLPKQRPPRAPDEPQGQA